MADASAVELIDVEKSLGDRRVVDRVSLRIARGEFFALLGPSGCGKTTSLRMMAGFEHPDAGRVLLGGRDVAGVPPYRRDCNIVFQSYALFPHLSVARNVAFGLEVAGTPRSETAARVAESLAMVRMDGLGDRMPHQLSGGQQQRVAVARALARRPSVLLLDEPLGALDLQLRKEMQLELKRLQRRLGTTFVHVTHDQEEAMALSDRVAVMDRGRVAQVGTPEDLWERPATAFVARFLGDANLLAGTVRDVSGGGARVDVPGGSLQATDAAGFGAGARVTVVVRPERLRVGDGGTLRGKVEETVFSGADLRHLVRLANEATLAVRRSADAGPRLRPGDEVTLGADPACVRLVPPEDALR
jgi:spermidine/putrescine transport system ATP-binding protein